MRRLSSILVALAVGAAAPASAGSTGSTIAVAEDCLDGVVLVPGVEERVRARVPAQFELVRDPRGRPLLFAFVSRCQRYSVGGPTPTTSGYFVAIIESPDGSGCLSRWPVVGAVKPDLVPLCNFYFLSGAFDNRMVVKTYRTFFPGIALRYVPDLAYELGDLDPTRLGAPLRFRAGPPTPSPFELDAVLREQPVAGPATFSFWETGSSGPVGARLEFDELALGPMDATLRLAPGSEMAALLGGETPTPIAGFVGRYPRTEISLLGRRGRKPATSVCEGRRATIVGSGRLRGTAGDDVIVGGEGRDRIDGRGGNDRICAGRGRDRLRGGPGHDPLFGGAGGDRLRGGPGRDRLSGGGGNDRLPTAGGGRDIVNCGSGRDHVRAGHRDRLRRCERVQRGR